MDILQTGAQRGTDQVEFFYHKASSVQALQKKITAREEHVEGTIGRKIDELVDMINDNDNDTKSIAGSVPGTVTKIKPRTNP